MDRATALKCALDPTYLFKEVTGLDPDLWQRQVLQSTSKRLLMLCGRQLGKTSVSAVKALHRVLFTERQEVLITSIGERQSLLLFDRCVQYYDRIRPVTLTKSLRTEMHFANGSKLIALPGDSATARGYTPHLVILDEASRIDEGMLAAVRPMLAETDGDLILLSTPAGRRGFFHSCWTDEEQQWERISARRVDYPHRVKPGFLEEERKILGPALYAQEHENAFIEDGDQLFGDDPIKAMSRCPAWLELMPALEGL
jgi:Terminase large subunit, T4likevirus-type, N-terminal